MATVNDIVQLAIEGTPDQMATAVDEVLKDKIQTAVDTKRVEIANNLVRKKSEE